MYKGVLSHSSCIRLKVLSRKPIFISCLTERDMHSEASEVLVFMYIFNVLKCSVKIRYEYFTPRIFERFNKMKPGRYKYSLNCDSDVKKIQSDSIQTNRFSRIYKIFIKIQRTTYVIIL